MVVFSDIIVWLVVSTASVRAGAGSKATVVVERCASVVVSSYSIAFTVVPLKADVLIVVGVSGACFVMGATVFGLCVGEELVSVVGLVAMVAFVVTGKVVNL